MKNKRRSPWIAGWKIALIWILAAALLVGSWTAGRFFLYEDLLTAFGGGSVQDEENMPETEADKQQNENVDKEPEENTDITVDEVTYAESTAVVPQYLQVFEYTDIRVSDKNSAYQALRDMQAQIGFSDAENEFAEPVISETPYYTFYRFDQMYGGYPVYGRSVILGTNTNGEVNIVSGNYIPLEGVELEVIVTEAEAMKIAEAVYYDVETDEETEKLLSKQPTIYNEGVFCYTYDEIPVLIWKIAISGSLNEGYCYISAVNGSVLQYVPSTYCDQAIGSGIDENGMDRQFPTEKVANNQYILEDTERRIQIYDADGLRKDLEIGSTIIVENGFFLDEDSDEFYTMTGRIESAGEDIARYEIQEVDSDTVINENDPITFYAEIKWGTKLIKIYRDGELLSEGAVFAQHLNGWVEELADSDNVWKDPTHVSAMANVQDICDFWSEVFGRKGYDNFWGPVALVCNALRGYNWDETEVNNTNAITKPFRLGDVSHVTILFGKDMLMDHDAIGHEYMHAVIRFTTALKTDLRMPSTLEEGLADVFGELNEDYAINGVLDNDCDWMHNDNRDLKVPLRTQTPAVYHGENWIFEGEESDVIHKNSTVFSHAMYKMSEGDVEAIECEGIGNHVLAHMLYATLHCVPIDCDFMQFGSVMLRMASNMAKDGMLTLKQVRCVYAALSECGILPVYEVTENSELTFYDLNGDVITDYDMEVTKVNLNEEAIMQYGAYTTVSITGQESYSCSLNVGDQYHVIIRSAQNPEILFDCYLEVVEDGADQADIYTSIIQTYEVINNGGRYVEWQGRTYYWKYSNASFSSSGLYGNYDKTDAANQLINRSDDGTETVIKEANAYGNLYIAAGRIYYEERSGQWKSVLLDGSDEKSHGDRNYIAADAMNGVLIYQNDSDGEFYSEDSQGNTRILSGDRMLADDWPVFLEVHDGSLYYYMTTRQDDGHVNLITCRADIATGETTYQGMKTIECMYDQGVSCDIEFWGDYAYLGYTNVGGSGMFHSHGGIYRMDLTSDEATDVVVSQNSSDALCYSDIAVGADTETGEAKILFYMAEELSSAGMNTHPWIDYNIREHNLETDFVKINELPLIFDGGYARYNGDVVVNKNGEITPSIVISQATLSEYGYTNLDAYDTGAGHAIQYVEVVGEKAYIAIEEIVEDPENSIGWRTAYKRGITVIYETVVGSDELVEVYRY